MRAMVIGWYPRKSDPDWDPLNGKPSRGDTMDRRDIRYIGPARVQPNKDWRARQIESPGQIPVQHAWRIQVDMMGNRYDPDNPEIWLPPEREYAIGETPAETRFRVVQLVEKNGVKVASMVGKFTYIVRNISEGSNSWVRTLLCDADVTDISANEVRPYGP